MVRYEVDYNIATFNIGYTYALRVRFIALGINPIYLKIIAIFLKVSQLFSMILLL